MSSPNLFALGADHLARAHAAGNGRSAHTVHGGADRALRQTLIALVAGAEVAEHNSPGDASLQVLSGQVRVDAGAVSVEGQPGDVLDIPPVRHSLAAVKDSVVLLTVSLNRAE